MNHPTGDRRRRPRTDPAGGTPDEYENSGIAGFIPYDDQSTCTWQERAEGLESFVHFGEVVAPVNFGLLVPGTIGMPIAILDKPGAGGPPDHVMPRDDVLEMWAARKQTLAEPLSGL